MGTAPFQKVREMIAGARMRVQRSSNIQCSTREESDLPEQCENFGMAKVVVRRKRRLIPKGPRDGGSQSMSNLI